MPSFGYRAVQELVLAECAMQLERAMAGDDEVLNVPIILGGVGLGKTSIARYVARQLGYELVKINCGECSDPSEFGMPVPFFLKNAENIEHSYMPWVLNRALHVACERPVVLFFDDIDKAPALVEGALLGIFGERSTRDRRLHPETVLIAAGNRVDDDALARRLSESLRTRGTCIHLEPRLSDFAAFARDNPERVHPAVLGFLTYRPSLLHKHDAEADRFPTPRCWVEASAHLFRNEPKAKLKEAKSHEVWKTAIALKCGEPVANEFWAWWTICSRIDLKKLLLTGEIEHNVEGAEGALIHFAAIFALAQELNTKGAKKEHAGLIVFLKALEPEHRVALLTQLTHGARAKVAKALPETASFLLSDIVALEAAGA